MFQKDAIVRLLRDNDPATVALLKDQLIESGSDGLAALRDLLSLDDAAVTAHVREVLEKIETDQAQDEMLLCAHLFPEHGDIEAAWWLLTLCFEPDAPIGEIAARARRMGAPAAHAGRQSRLGARTAAGPNDVHGGRPRFARQRRGILRSEETPS